MIQTGDCEQTYPRQPADIHAACHRLFQPTRKGVRGSYTGKRAEKLSAQRITSLFGEHELTIVQHKSKRGVCRTVQSLTSADIDRNDAWVSFNLCLLLVR